MQIGEFHLAERERREALATQKQMSKQQFFNSLAGTIATLNDVEKHIADSESNGDRLDVVSSDRHVSIVQQRLALRAIVASTINDAQMLDLLEGDWLIQVCNRSTNVREPT